MLPQRPKSGDSGYTRRETNVSHDGHSTPYSIRHEQDGTQSMANTGTNENALVRQISPRNGEAIELSAITSFVGPNDSGKTDALEDILRLAANFDPAGGDQPSDGGTKVLRDLALRGKLTLERLLDGLVVVGGTEDGSPIVQGFGPDLSRGVRITVSQDVKSILRRPSINSRSVCSTALGDLMPLRATYLASDNRDRLVESCPVARPDQVPESLLQALHDAPQEVHDQLDTAFTTAFAGTHIWLDASARVELSLRAGKDFLARSGDPLADLAASEQQTRLDEVGQGWKSFAGIVLGVLLSPGRFVLIDEPELHLHPGTARQLGRWLAQHVDASDCQLILATNCEHFLAGLYDGDTPVTLVRTSQVSRTTHLQAVARDAGRELATEPRLAHQRALNCVFSEGVILVPGSADALVYEAVATRQLARSEIRFLHAHGAGNLASVARSLRHTGLSLGVVAGLDLFNSEDKFCELVEAASGEETPRPWLATRERLATHLEGALDESTLSSSAQEVEEFLDRYQRGEEGPDTRSPGAAVGDSKTVSWRHLTMQALLELPAELGSWVEDLLEDLKQRGIYIAPRPVADWFRDPPDAPPRSWLDSAVSALLDGAIPGDLQAFVNELTTVVASMSKSTK